MKKILVLLCLGLIGCAATTKEGKTPLQAMPKTITQANYVPFEENDINGMISVFDEAIKDRPNFAGFYYNRGVAYFYKKDYDKSWQDVHKAESLGYKFNADFVESLKKASGREK